jgi:hypothetical protein
VVSFNFDALTPDELAAVRKLLATGAAGMPAPAHRVWPEPALLTEAELADLAPVPRPPQPPPECSTDEFSIWERRLVAWHNADFDRCKRLAALGVQRRSQLECQKKYPPDGLPLWRCSVEPAGDGCPDSGLFPLLIPAETEWVAGDRYCEICGLVGGRDGLMNDGRHQQRLVIRPAAVPVPVAAEVDAPLTAAAAPPAPDAVDAALTPDRQGVRDCLRAADRPLDIPAVAAAVGLAYDACAQLLHRMAAAGEVVREARGLYALPAA